MAKTPMYLRGNRRIGRVPIGNMPGVKTIVVPSTPGNLFKVLSGGRKEIKFFNPKKARKK